MVKSSVVKRIEFELRSKYGYPKLDFLNKLTEKDLQLLSFHIINSRLSHTKLGIKAGLEVAKDVAKKKGYRFEFPDVKDIKITENNHGTLCRY